MPASPGDPENLKGCAFAHGYLKALIQAANSEVAYSRSALLLRENFTQSITGGGEV